MLGFDGSWNDAALRGPVEEPRHAATDALVARMAVPLWPARTGSIDRLIRTLIEADIWPRLEALYVMAAHDAQTALLDWIGQHGTAAVGGGAPTFVTDRGLHCDGRDDWICLGSAPSQTQRFTQNSAAIAIWTRNGNAGQSASVFGIQESTAIGLNPRGANGAIASRLKCATATVGAVVATGYGLTAVDRSSASVVQHYKNGTASGPAGSAASTAVSRATFTLGRGGGSFAGNQFCATVIGGDLTGTQHAALHAALEAYLTAVGVAELPIGNATRTIAAITPLPDGASGAVAGKGVDLHRTGAASRR